MSDKTAALLAAGNAMAERLREIEFSRYPDDWGTAVTALGEIPESANTSYVYGYLDACDRTSEVRDLARASILHYNELLQIARDLAAAITLPGSNVQATDAVARLQALDRKPKKVPPPPPPPSPGTPPPSSPMP